MSDDEVTRLRMRLSRLEAKHRRFAAETNRIITEQLAEIQRLRAVTETAGSKP